MRFTKNNKTDLLEIAIILAMFLLILVIYVPVSIWEEENYYKKESRYRMKNLYDVETFYSRLMGEYNTDFLEALSVVNATRDSTIADSLFVGEQIIQIDDKEYFVNVDDSYRFEYDTTFGIKSFRKDTVLDTTVQIVVYSEDLGRNDTSFIRKKDLPTFQSSNDFLDIIREEPLQRVQAIEYYKTYVPDDSTYYCPLTKKPYFIEIEDGGKNLIVSSPIVEPIVRSEYLLFSFKAISHGMIKNGRKSWD